MRKSTKKKKKRKTCNQKTGDLIQETGQRHSQFVIKAVWDTDFLGSHLKEEPMYSGAGDLGVSGE